MNLTKQNAASIAKKVLIVINLGLLIFAFWLTTKAPKVNIPISANIQANSNSTEAYYMCKHFIKEKLNDPKSLEFPDSNTAHITGNGDTYDIAGSFRANNALGAKVQSSYACTVTENPSKGTWTLVYLSEF